MKTVTLNNINEHLIFEHKGMMYLVDTGSPVTISSGAFIELFDNRINVINEYMGLTTAQLSEFVGTKIDVLLGADVMSNYYITINLTGGKITFSEESLTGHGTEIPIECFLGVPVIDFELGNNKIKGFVDTGASISYIVAGLTKGLKEGEIKDDFYPGVGRFKTQTYETKIKIGKVELDAVFGILPPALELSLMMADCKGIIGLELFKKYEVIIDYKNEKLILK